MQRFVLQTDLIKRVEVFLYYANSWAVNDSLASGNCKLDVKHPANK